MRISRRNWLKTGALAGTAALVPFTDWVAEEAEAAVPPAPPQEAALAAATNEFPLRGAFKSRLQQAFALKGPNGTVSLRLRAVTDLPSAKTSGTVGHPDCFNLIFKGPLTPRLPQNTYTLWHPTMGTMHIFLVPGRRSGEQTYVATFNRVSG